MPLAFNNFTISRKGVLLSARLEKQTMLHSSPGIWMTKLVKPQVLPEWKRIVGELPVMNQPAA